MPRPYIEAPLLFFYLQLQRSIGIVRDENRLHINTNIYSYFSRIQIQRQILLGVS